MSEQLKIFENSDFGTIRTIIINDEPYFVGKDVAEILGYSNPRKALSDHVYDEDKTNEVTIRDSIGRNQNPIVINESGLYSLILSSKLPTAKKFKHWITSEVLPSIRKTGTYTNPKYNQENLLTPEIMIAYCEMLQAERKKNEELQTVNSLLTKEAHEWDDRKILSALVRSYSCKCKKTFQGGWCDFYKAIEYKLGINLKERKTKRKSSEPYVGLMTIQELKESIRVITAMCEDVGINVSDVINKYNYAKISVN